MGIDKRQFSIDRQLLEVKLAQMGERSHREILAVMREEGENIRDLARDFAPVDEGDLERAIEVEEDRAGINGRAQVYVHVNPEYEDERGTRVEMYGLLMHEGLAPYGSGRYKLGKRSLAKDGGSGRVGGKFLERAVRARIGIIGKKIRQAMERVMR